MWYSEDIERVKRTFDYLLHQNVQPYSDDEKADALELIGSTRILDGIYIDGVEFWKMSLSFRSTPRLRLPESEIPRVIIPCVRPEWSNAQDLNQMLNEYLREDNRINMLYQAMLVRIRLSKEIYSEAICKLFSNVRRYYFSHEAYHYLLALLLELDEVYASHSLSLVPETDYDVGPLSRMINSFITATTDKESKPLWIERSLVVLKWLATEASRNNVESYCIKTRCFPNIPGTHLINWLAGILAEPLNDSQNLEMKKYIQGLMNLRDMAGTNFLMMVCFFLAQRPNLASRIVMNDTVHVKNLVRLLVELGADLNSVDYSGNTCLHIFIDVERGCVFKPSIVQFLLDRGARWDMKNNRDQTPGEMLTEAREKIGVIGCETVVSASSSYFSLKWLCARVLRREKMDLSGIPIPKTIMDYIKFC